MPLGESMITTLRSNKRKNVNDTFLKNGITTIKDRQKGSFDHKKASPELIHKIKMEMQKKQKRRRVKLLYVGILISIVMLCCLWYLEHFNYI